MNDGVARGRGGGRWRGWAPLCVLLAGLALAYALGLHRYVSFEALRDNRDALQAFVAEDRVAAALAFTALYALVVALSLPGGAIMTAAGGFLFGTVLASLCVVVGATAGAVALFLAARTAWGEVLRRRAEGPWIARMRRGFQEHPLSYLLFLRLVPVFPFWLVNLVPAFLGVGLPVYFVGTLFGIIPGALVYASLGNGLDAVFATGGTPDLDILFRADVLLPVLGLALLSLLPVAVGRLRGRRDAEADGR